MTGTTWVTHTLVRDGRPVARKVRELVLEVRGPDGARTTHRFGQPGVRVGSRPGCDVVLDDATVSRLHFEITAEEHGFRLRDLGSTNGTIVDGYLVHDIHLRDGSVIQVGGTTIAVVPGEREHEVPVWDGDVFGTAVGKSLAMRELFAILARAAKSDATVLFEGESGTGKEVLAASLHAAGTRSREPFVVVDCGAVPSGLLESLLFGHERGAFTGATERRIGQFEEASGGTLFLDEIGELPLDLQPKLLRVLEARAIRRVGATETLPVDVRIVAATNRDLAEEVNRGAFREDLYYRIAVIRVRVPPLRERREDIRLLLEHFVRRAFPNDAAKADRVIAKVDPASWASLESHPWPGNVRELRNVVERSLALGGGADAVELAPEPRGGARHASALEVDLDAAYGDQKTTLIDRFDQAYLLGQLERHGGNISRAARAAGMERMHFKRMLKKHT